MFIKGIILVCLTSILSVFQLNAQDRFSIGPRVGLNFSNVSNFEGSESLTGLALGLTSTYSISESTGITVDLLYSGEGFTFGGDDYKLSYLQLPILFDVFFGELGSSFRPKVYAGVAPGFLMGYKVNDDKADKDDLNSINLSLVGGLGFNARVASRIWLNADLRAYLGLSDYNDNGGDKSALSTIQPSIGLAYGLSKLD
ncbi:MAG: porin family protein [Saprospiraceae bacterium]